MPEYLSPGVYVEEFDSGAAPIVGAETSTAGFVGLAEKGPVGGAPQLVTEIADFRRNYGGYLSAGEFGEYRYLSYAVEQFFANGGAKAYISRVAPPDAKKAQAQIGPLKLTAASCGAWGNELAAVIAPASKASAHIRAFLSPRIIRLESSTGFNAGDVVVLTDGAVKIYNRIVMVQGNSLELQNKYDKSVIDRDISPQTTLSTCEFNLSISHGGISESYSNLSLNAESPEFIAKKLAASALVGVELGEAVEDITLVGAENADTPSVTVAFVGGDNGSMAAVTADMFIGEDSNPGKRTGIQAFIDNSNVSIMAVPGATDPDVQRALVAHCESLASRFAVLDMPKELAEPEDLIAHRELINTSYAAFYHPWLCIRDPLDKSYIQIPPSGSVIGIYARTDSARGVHKAQANEIVRGCAGLYIMDSKFYQEDVTAKGINLLRMTPDRGTIIWGARTASSDALWKYVNVRRLFIYVEESIRANTNWVAFEPNNETLWARVNRTITMFLENLWRNGVLFGASPSEAFYVQIGHDTMSQDDIDNGRLICVIGMAAVRPAEFATFSLTQYTAT